METPRVSVIWRSFNTAARTGPACTSAGAAVTGASASSVRAKSSGRTRMSLSRELRCAASSYRSRDVAKPFSDLHSMPAQRSSRLTSSVEASMASAGNAASSNAAFKLVC